MLYALDSMTFDHFAPDPEEATLLDADTFEFKTTPALQRSMAMSPFVAHFLMDTGEPPRPKPKRLIVEEIYVEEDA